MEAGETTGVTCAETPRSTRSCRSRYTVARTCALCGTTSEITQPCWAHHTATSSLRTFLPIPVGAWKTRSGPAFTRRSSPTSVPSRPRAYRLMSATALQR